MQSDTAKFKPGHAVAHKKGFSGERKTPGGDDPPGGLSWR